MQGTELGDKLFLNPPNSPLRNIKLSSYIGKENEDQKIKQWPQDHTQLEDVKAGTQTKLYLPTPRAHMIRNGGAGCSDLSAGLPHSTPSPGWSSETLQDIKKTIVS